MVSVTGKPLFVAPIGRTAEDFIAESEVHGWPSFRDQEVVWDNVRVLKGIGETVSLDGTVSSLPFLRLCKLLFSLPVYIDFSLLSLNASTPSSLQHLGHNLPDKKGNR